MSEIVYIILAHKNPFQLKRLIESLRTSNSYFYVHVDAKSDIKIFETVLPYKRVFFVQNRIKCIWGDFSLVEATLILIKEALKNHNRGHCVLLSGQDYPIKPVGQIENFLFRNNEKNFISVEKIEEVWNERECGRRTKYYRINLSVNKGDYVLLRYPGRDAIGMLLNKRISLGAYVKLFSPRKINIELYGGSQWWTINFRTLRKLNRYIEANRRKLFDYFRDMNCADEIFFHSIIKELEKTDKTIFLEGSITYANWQPQNSFSPEIFTREDYDLLHHQPDHILFARKFDLHRNGKILDLIDAGIEI